MWADKGQVWACGEAEHGCLGLELEAVEHKIPQENWDDDSDDDVGRIIRKHVSRTRGGARRQMLRPTPEDELVKYDIEYHYPPILKPRRLVKFDTMKKRPRLASVACGAFSSFAVAGVCT